MGLILAMYPRILVLLQGAEDLPPGVTQEQYDRVMAMLPFYAIMGLLLLVVGIWMVIDAWNNYGSGWGVVSCLGCLFFSWIAIIIYLVIRFAAAPPEKMRERAAAERSYQPSSVYGAQASATPQDIALTPQEQDEKLDDLLAQGKAREAMDYAQQMYKMAQDFKDKDGKARYAKYIERIRRGIK